MSRRSCSAADAVKPLIVWAALALLYLLLAGDASVAECSASALTALAGALLSCAVRLQGGRPANLHGWRLLRRSAQVAAILPKDTFMIGAALLSPGKISGNIEAEALLDTRPAMRGFEIMAASLTPDRFVIGVDQEDRMLLHRLKR